MSVIPIDPVSPLASSKEQFWQMLHKFDAVNLQGVWTNFPGAAQPQHGRVHVASILYRRLMEEEQSRRRKTPRRETGLQMRQRLLAELERRLVEIDLEDLVLFLAG